ncbi:MAG: SDR family oxidoreductase [Actinobacteria bacterium]|nr:SDR family oxidoreductase [Actinomycetota bacterium]
MVVGPHSVLLTGRIAVVTGAAAGIGRAVAETFARFGARVAACDRDGDALSDLDTEWSAVLDVRDGDGVTEFIGHLDRVDVLVNNAGGTFAAPFLDVGPGGQQALVDENFTRVTHCIRAAVPKMRAGGSIINITSIEAHRAGPRFAIYSAMKAVVANLTKSLAVEFDDRSIRVDAIAPDAVATPGIGAGHWPGRPDDVAGAAVFLASDLSRFVTGTTIHVDGGNWAAGGWRPVGAPQSAAGERPGQAE